jgi:hypothetical protein
MAYRNGNYSAFYVKDPFNESTLGAHATPDFNHYQLIKAWKAKDANFSFNNAHEKTYSVRDGSDWETTLKPRLRERLRNSKNILLFLSSNTIASKALTEEISYGINDQGLPVIVIYPDYKSKETLLSGQNLSDQIRRLWDKLPIFRDSMSKVPTLHVPLVKDIISSALLNSEFMLASKVSTGIFFYGL